MKKKFLTFALALLVVILGGVMFACGENGINPYSQLNEMITEITTDTTTYQTADVLDGRFNGYTIKDLAHKTNEGTLEEDGQILNGLFAISMDKIVKYMGNLQDVKASKLDALNKAFKTFKKEYNDFVGARGRFVSLEDGASIDIFNGFYAKYREEAKGYVSATGDLAKEILKVCDETFTLPENEEEVSEAKKEQWLIKYDNEVVKGLCDTKALLLESAKGEILTNNLYLKGVENLKNIALNAKRTEFNLQEENVEKFEKISLALDNQRKITFQAIDNFSIYTLEKDYENTLYLYYRTDSTKEFDYVQLDTYFGTGGILQTYFTTINNF